MYQLDSTIPDIYSMPPATIFLPPLRFATASQNGHSLFLPVLNGTDTRTENVSQLLFVDFHCSFHGQKQRKETTEAKKLAFSTCRFLSFQRVF